MKTNILLCVAGGTPQIITETLFALTQRQESPIRIDEIRVITTLEGRNKVLSTLLDKEKGIFYQFCDDFGIDSDSILFDETCISLLRTRDGRTLDDIRLPEENELAGDQICEIVRELCKNENNCVFASAAGGRKTMSIYLTLAMSLFGRAEDSLSHVLVNADFENNRDFFYPPPRPKMIDVFNPQTKETGQVSTETAQIYLAPIPFIRLQGTQNSLKLPDGKKYGELVKEAQSFLDKDERKLPLSINLKTKEISVDDVTVKVSDYELLLYVLFAEKKFSNEGENGFVQLNSLSREDFEKAFGKIMTARDEDETICENLIDSDWEFLWILIQQLEATNTAKTKELREKEWKNFRDSLMRAFRRSDDKLKAIPDKYKISSIGVKRPKKYGLQTPKELINIL